jgi:hypothetical protein
VVKDKSEAGTERDSSAILARSSGIVELLRYVSAISRSIICDCPRGGESGSLKVGEWVSLNLRISRIVDLWQDSTCPKQSANRKNSRIGKSAISQKQPTLFSGKQWETSSLGRAPRRSVILAQVGVDNVILVRPSLGL